MSMAWRKLSLVLLAVLVAACAAGVRRVETDSATDLSGTWNDTDSRLVSEEMIRDSLERPWLQEFGPRHGGKRPVVIVGTVKNLSHEHISTGTFVKDLERSLLNSGRVDFVASREERDEVRDERRDQAMQSSEATAKAMGEETGADYMLKGSINTIIDRAGGTEVKFYQVNLELVDLESNRKVWIGEKKIKKVVTRSRFGM